MGTQKLVLEILTRLISDPLVCYFRMTSKPIELEPYHHAYACACLGWKCFICNGEANDQIGIQDQHTTFNVSPLSQSNRSMPKDGHSPVHLMNVKEKQIKRVTNPRSINRVIKQVTIFGLPFNFYSMKQKFSTKGKDGQVLKTPEQRKKVSSHVGQKLQKWKEEDMKEAERLWALNDTLPPKERLSMRAIAAKVGIGKTTVIERLSGRHKGEGHTAGGR